MKPYQYGLNEVDELNLARIHSSVIHRHQPLLDGGHVITFDIPANSIFLLDSFFLEATSGAVAGVFLANLFFLDFNGFDIYDIYSHIVMPANHSCTFNFVRDIDTFLANDRRQNIRLPNWPVTQCMQMVVNVIGMLAGDEIVYADMSYRQCLLGP